MPDFSSTNGHKPQSNGAALTTKPILIPGVTDVKLEQIVDAPSISPASTKKRRGLKFTPLADVKEYPEAVDVALVEGAVANEEHLEFIQRVRQRTRILVSFGDCAVTGNVTSLRNPLGGPEVVLRRSYLEGGDLNARVPDEAGIVPPLLKQVKPIHAVVPVDIYLPGCPPPAARRS